MHHATSTACGGFGGLARCSPSDLIERAALLTNPASGIANDFMNHFNEIVLLVENLPLLLPEMLDELMQWQPTTYRAYFERSNLPGRNEALETYERIAPELRAAFDAAVEGLNDRARRIIALIAMQRDAAGNLAAESVADLCAAASRDLREALARAASLVDTGHPASCEPPQSVADRLLAT